MNKKGLTLIELLGVIIVIGIIAAISFPAINGVISNSRRDTVIENARTFVNTVDNYVGQLFLTGNESELGEDTIDETTEFTVTVEELKAKGYLDDKFSGDAKSKVVFKVELDNNDIFKGISILSVTYSDTKVKYNINTESWNSIKRDDVDKGEFDFNE